MDSVERILRTIDHKEPDRIAMHDQFWPSTIERWHAEGLPANVPSIEPWSKEAYERTWLSTDMTPSDYFGLDIVKIRPDISPRFPTELIDDGGNVLLERTPYGTLRRQIRQRSSTPEVVEWSIKSRDDWDRIKQRLEPDPTRINWAAARMLYDSARKKGQFVVFDAHIGFAQFLEYIRSDELLMLMAMDPEWFKEMLAVHADLVVGMAQIMWDGGLHYDGGYLACDLGYRNTTFFSPLMYRQLQFPYDKQVFRYFRDKGMPVTLHSDGRVKGFIPQFLEAGISVLNPIETKAGMDLIELKREYGRDLSFMGGIDARAIADPNPSVVEDEIKRKFAVAMDGGGYIYHSDHSIPDNTSLQQYLHVLELVRQYGVYR
ncbi:MAG: uroporphyrinogen decarboxylase family protein [Chloroflexota bacterium]